MDELVYLRFTFDKHQLGISNSGFKDCQRNYEVYSNRIQEKDQFLGGDYVQRLREQDSVAHDELE